MLWKCIEEGPKFKNFPRKVKEQGRGEKEKKEKGEMNKNFDYFSWFWWLGLQFFFTYVEKGQVFLAESI